jgi:gamma-glutamyl hydrolase
MGYESIANFSAVNGDPNEKYYLTHTSLPLKFVRDPRDTLMYGQL